LIPNLISKIKTQLHIIKFKS